MILVSLTGEAESGKDTFYGLLSAELYLHYVQVYSIAFATKMKESLSMITCIPLEHFYRAKNDKIDKYNMTIRELMQRYSDVTKELLGEDLYIKCAEHELNSIKEYKDTVVIFTDSRHKAELNWLNSKGAIMVRINDSRVKKMNHRSETEMDEFNKWDWIIENDGTISDLREKAKIFINKKLNFL